MPESSLIDLQVDIADRLTADDFFADVPVLHERKADIGSAVEKAVGTLAGRAGRSGCCLIVMQPVASVTRKEVKGALMDVELTIRVLENVTINQGITGTRKPALALARRAARVLHLYRPDGLAQVLVADSPTIVPVEDPLVPLAYEVRFTTSEADTTTNAKVGTPSVLPVSGSVPLSVTLSCPTAGASIWYSLDGSHPAPGVPGATQYTAAIALQTACNLRACAFLSGYIASDTILGIYT